MRCSVVGAIVLALGIQQALPVVCLLGLLGVDVHKHLNLSRTQEATLSGLEDQEVLLLNNQTSERANDGWRDTPVNKFTVGHLEGRAVQRAHNHVTNHVRTLTHGCANVRAQVAYAEECTSLGLANQDIVACKGPKLAAQLAAARRPSLRS